VASLLTHYSFIRLRFSCLFLANHLIALLAVRTSGATKVFKVLFERPRSRKIVFSAQPLTTANFVGSDYHVDVTFNPWYDRQFAAIDQKGTWRVWDIEGAYESSRKGSGITLKSTAEGRMTVFDGQKGHGWGRITWGEDLNSVLACDRHTVALFDMRTKTASPSIALPVNRDRNWILDLQRGPIQGGHDAFVLTSSDVTWIDIRQPGRPLLSWRHRRHRDDVSLHLELFYSRDGMFDDILIAHGFADARSYNGHCWVTYESPDNMLPIFFGAGYRTKPNYVG
jgi:hypothetical protein